MFQMPQKGMQILKKWYKCVFKVLSGSLAFFCFDCGAMIGASGGDRQSHMGNLFNNPILFRALQFDCGKHLYQYPELERRCGHLLHQVAEL